jgi:hypothetical protein
MVSDAEEEPPQAESQEDVGGAEVDAQALQELLLPGARARRRAGALCARRALHLRVF